MPFIQCGIDSPQESYFPDDDITVEEGVLSAFTSLEGAEEYMHQLIEDYEMRPSALKILYISLKALWGLIGEMEEVYSHEHGAGTFRIDLVEQVGDRTVIYDVLFSRIAPIN